jgi:hypothetical protein
MRHYLKYLALATVLALVYGAVMLGRWPAMAGVRSEAVAATRGVPPIDSAQPATFQTATFAFG